MINFNNIPDSRVPFAWLEFDNSAASGSKPIWKTLIIGYKLASGSANTNDLYLVGSEKQAIEFFGLGSNLHHQFSAYKNNETTIEVWCLPVPEGTKEASASISFDFVDLNLAISEGLISLLLFGEIIDIPVKGSKDIKDITKIIAENITQSKKVPVNASVDSSNPKVINFTTLHKSNIYNYGYTVVKNELENKPLPGNLKIVSSASNTFSGGIGDPDLDYLFKNVIKDLKFNTFVTPFYSAIFTKNFSDILEKRWGPGSQTDGALFLTTTMTDLNSQQYKDCFTGLNCQYILPYCYSNSPTPAYIINASIAAQVSFSASLDPGMPLHNLTLYGVKAPTLKNRLSMEERSALLNNGFGTITTVGDSPIIERSLTSYKLNDANVPDESYLNAEKTFTLSYLRYDFKTYFWGKYNRYKLADDGTEFEPGQKIITPNVAKSEAIGCFLKWEKMGLVQDSKAFISNLIVQRNLKNRGRLDFLLPPTLINQLIQVAVQIQFR